MRSYNQYTNTKDAVQLSALNNVQRLYKKDLAQRGYSMGGGMPNDVYSSERGSRIQNDKYRSSGRVGQNGRGLPVPSNRKRSGTREGRGNPARAPGAVVGGARGPAMPRTRRDRMNAVDPRMVGGRKGYRTDNNVFSARGLGVYNNNRGTPARNRSWTPPRTPGNGKDKGLSVAAPSFVPSGIPKAQAASVKPEEWDICWDFNSEKGCRWGDGCRWKHVSYQLQKLHPITGKPLKATTKACVVIEKKPEENKTKTVAPAPKIEEIQQPVKPVVVVKPIPAPVYHNQVPDEPSSDEDS